MGAPWNFGIGQDRLLIAHAAVPTLLSATLAVATGAGVSLIASGVHAPTAMIWCAAVAIFCVFLNALSALKGPLPAEYLSPVPSPMGDFSGVLVLMWLSDAVLVAIAVIGALTARIASGHGLETSAIWLVVAAVVVTLWARNRLARRVAPDS